MMAPVRHSAHLVSLIHRRWIFVRLCLIVAGICGASGDLTAQEKSGTESRWEKEIQQIESKIASGQTKKNSIVFVGSSSIRLWDLEAGFPELVTANHGFGGSQISDAVQFFDRIVTVAQPRVVVLYAGDNDINNQRSAEDVVTDFERFVKQCRTDLKKGTPVLFIAIKPSVRRWTLAPTMHKANDQIRTLCERDPDLYFVDIWKPMLTQDGVPQPDLFRDDGLHLNAKGYSVWNAEVAQTLKTALAADPSR